MPERGDLLLIPFPFTDLSAAKRRPVLALTAAGRVSGHIVTAAIVRLCAYLGYPEGK
jgi:hypothetical protein